MTNLRLDLRSKYSLLQAFDEIGRARFPDEWQGEEAWAKPSRTDLEKVPHQRQQAEQRLTNVLKQILELNAAFDTSENDAERKALSSLLPDLYSERDDLNGKINSLPDPTQGDIEDGKQFARRSEVEQRLNTAFGSGDLRVLFGRNIILQWNECSREQGLKVSYILSQVTLPAHRTPKGTHPAFIDRAQLDGWVERMFEPQDDGSSNFSTAELCRQWLEDQVQKLQPREKTKTTLRTEAMAKFPTLTTRMFDQVWANTVPDSWKKAGRKPE